MTRQRALIIGSIWGIGNCLVVNPASSQIIPDGTTNTSIVNNCQSSCKIDGGTIAEQNLFHSFQEFNVAPEASVYFADPGVANIFSRITGSNPSDIFGTLGVMGGDANLFLLNPHGIVFGEGAALDLNGSFFATTADEIKFGDRGSFSTDLNSTENPTLLTVDPSALFFNQAAHGSITLKGAELTVPPQQNITLLGQNSNNPGIVLKNSAIDVSAGNIALGALGVVESNAEIGIGDNLQLQFPDDVVRGDVTLAKSSITATNSGATSKEISINAHNLEIREDSTISTITTGIDNGADLNINARESVKIIGTDSQAFQQFLAGNLTPGGNSDFTGSGLQTITLGTGNAGDIQITTSNLTVDNGAGIVSTTRDRGTTGNIDIDVADTFLLRGSGLLTGSGTFTLGKVGEIKIDTDRLLVDQGGVISSSTLGDGDAGNLTINAADSIEVSQTPADSVIPTGIYTNTIFGNGHGGDLKLDTRRSIVKSGGQLSSSSGAITRKGLIPFGGQGGNILLEVADSLEVGGTSSDGVFYSSILSDTRSNSPGGNLNIDTNTLLLGSEGFISASSIGTGMGGNIEINARDSVRLTGNETDNNQQLFVNGLTGQLDLSSVRQGLIAYTILSGDGGDISLSTSQLSLQAGAVLATATLGNGDAGNLKITASDRLDVISSTIAAPTFDRGHAGKIDINTKNLSVAEGATIASASIGRGNAGDLLISATESIEIYNNPNLLFSSNISTGSYRGIAFPGNITISTQRLSIENGASIQANNIFLGLSETTDRISPIDANIPDGKGKLTITASQSIEISGKILQNNPFGISSNSYISSTTSTLAPASDIQITTPNLAIFDGGEISVNSLGSGAAGTLEIVADNVTLEDRGRLNGTTKSGRGGDIMLQVDNILRLEDNSSIGTDAIALGDGGNIDLTADFIVASRNSSITANAAEIGIGGNIEITAKDLFFTSDSQITADSTLGIDGTVEIKTSIDIEHNSYTELPQKVIQVEQTILQSCSNRNNRQDVFSYTGRGGLPSSPLTEFQANNIVIVDFEIPHKAVVEDEFEADMTFDVPQSKIVEANRWQINASGKVELIASTDLSSPAIESNYHSCPLSNYK